MKNRLFAFMAAILFAAPLFALQQPVKTGGGLVSGIAGTDKSVLVFKGIPFAAPPVGDLRWRAPQPAAAWDGVRKAEKFSASCMQNIVDERKPWTYEFMTHTEVSEDCLYLNVWTAAKSASEKRPVFVYIHGGGFSEGSGAVPAYDGEGLARKGLVVVTINYRLGILGFFVHPELSKESLNGVSGNYALLDMIAALRWIQAGIANFGGDPNRVTIAGQSAGAMAVHDLIASPLAKGLFHRAIIESGGSTIGRAGINMGAVKLKDAEAGGVRFTEAKGAKSLADLRAMSWHQLTQPGAASGGSRPTSAPIVDGYVLPLSPNDAVFQGKHNDVPVLTGMNAGELGGLVAPPGQVTLEKFRSQASQRYGADADKFLALYAASNDAEAAAAQTAANRDQTLVSMFLWAKARSKASKTNVFQYLFDHPLPGPDSARYGAFHSGELPYVLNTLYACPRPITDVDRKIADMLSSYWANFAAGGDPNGKGLPPWPSYSEKRVVMEIGDKNEPIPIAGSAAKQGFFEEYLTP